MAQVASLHVELQRLNTATIAVSFGHPYWARAWMQETQSPFPVWLDPDLNSYHAFGLEKSGRRSWGVKNLLYYARALLRGQKLIENRGDTHQLGGNFIIDKQGVIQFAYPSRDPTDRPTVNTLLDVLRRLEKERVS